MPLADFNQAMDVLKQNIGEVQQTRSIEAANQQVEQIKTAGMAEHEQNNALRSVANNLTMQLTRYGMEPTKINQVASAAMPYNPTYQNYAEAMMSGDPEKMALGQKVMQQEFQNKRTLELDKTNAMLQGLGLKKDTANLKLQRDAANDWATKDGYGKKLLGNYQEAQNIIDAADTGDPAAINLGGINLIKRIGGINRVNQIEIEKGQINPSEADKIARAYDRAVKGEALPEDVGKLKQLGQILKQQTADEMSKNIDMYSRGRAKSFNMTPAELADSLKTTHIENYVSKTGASAPSGGLSPQAKQALDWLLDPNGKDKTPENINAVKAAVKALLGGS